MMSGLAIVIADEGELAIATEARSRELSIRIGASDTGIDFGVLEVVVVTGIFFFVIGIEHWANLLSNAPFSGSAITIDLTKMTARM